jgi:uncharacterized protein (TIGR03437 family)
MSLNPLRKACLIGIFAVLFGHSTGATASSGSPVLSYATYLGGYALGGNPTTSVTAIAVDSQNSLYIVGGTAGAFPTTPGSYQPQFVGGHCVSGTKTVSCTDAFVAKISRAGSLIWSTYIGGTQNDYAFGIALDEEGNVYVAGITYSTDFPVTADAFQKNGPGAFLLKLDATGSRLLYSSFLGAQKSTGLDRALALAYAPTGDLYVAGYTASGSFPVRNALQSVLAGGDCSDSFQKISCGDAFVMRWRASDMSLLASTLLGGTGDDSANALTLDHSGAVYLAGYSSSPDFPARSGVQSGVGAGVCQGSTAAGSACPDAFISKLSADLSTLLSSTRLGGSASDIAYGIAVDPQGQITVAGATDSLDFPMVNAPQPGLAAFGCPSAASTCSHGFVAGFAADGSIVYSTYLGGSSNDVALAVALDESGNAYVAGGTESTDFLITPDAVQHCNARSPNLTGGTAFVTEFTPDGRLIWSSFLGGSQFDRALTIASTGGKIFLGGVTSSQNFPVTASAIQSTAPLTNGIGFVGVLDFTRDYSGPPYVEPACVLNAASFQSGPVAPGEIVAIYGTALGPEGGTGAVVDDQGRIGKSLAGVEVTFDGTRAPLLWVSSHQINAVVPFNTAGTTATKLAVSYSGLMSVETSLLVNKVAAGIFTYSGSKQAAALNQDGTLNGPANPAKRDSVVTIWMTGAGPLSAAYDDGQIVTGAPAVLPNPPGVGLGVGVARADVVYAGQAPGMVAGVVQVNFVIPNDAPTGAAIELYVGIPIYPAVQSPAVTLAII